MRLETIALLTLAFLTPVHAAESDFVTVNLTFEFNPLTMDANKTKERLPGTVPDGATFFEWSKKAGQPTLTLRESDMAAGKGPLLEKLRQFVAKNPNINFNYSGHGWRQEIEEGQYGPSVDSSGNSCDPKTTTTDCERKVLKEPRYRYYLISGHVRDCETSCSKAQQVDLQQRVKPCESAAKTSQACLDSRRLETACYKPYYDCIRARAKAYPDEGESAVLAFCDEHDRKCKQDPQLKEFQQHCARVKDSCRDGFEERLDTCSQSCLENYALTDEDLSGLFKDKTVFGVIDACHSGGIAEQVRAKNKLLLTSAAADQKAADSRDGGFLVRQIDLAIENEFCKHDGRSAKVNAEQLLSRIVNFLAVEPPQSQTSQRVKSGSGFDQIVYLKAGAVDCSLVKNPRAQSPKAREGVR